ncbi:MAG: hypothetical protein NVS1B13_25590 [Flavisolibacter sp.]
MPTEKVLKTWRIDKGVIAELQRLAKADDRKLNPFVELVLRKFIEQKKGKKK